MNRLRAALVTPVTGPLSDFGIAGATALRLWAEAAEADVTVHDAHPDPTAAVASAEATRPDLLFGPYGSGPAAAVVAATSRLLWNHGGARVPPSPRVVSLLAPASTYWEGAVRVTAPHVRRVAVLHGPTGFGRAVGEGAVAAARGLGLAADSHPVTAAAPEGDLLLVAGGFAQEQAAAARLLPWPGVAAGLVGAGVEEVLAGLGRRREGLLGPTQWLASAAPDPDEGPTAAEFVTAFRRATGEEPSYPAAQAFAAGLVAARCVRDAGSTADDDVRAAAAACDLTTMFARFRLDPATGEQVGHRVLTVQWQDGERRVVWPPGRATLRLTSAPGRRAARP